MSKKRRPSSFRVGRSVAVRVVRGPHKTDSSRWYWRADRSAPDGRECVWSGWGTAAEVEQKIAGALARGSLGDPAARASDEVRTVRDLMEVWTGYQEQRCKAKRIADSTYVIYERVGRRICRQPLACCSLTELNVGRLERYVNQRLAAGGAVASVRVEMTLLKAAWDWGQQRDLVPQRVLRKPELKAPPREVFTPTRAEWNRVLARIAEGWPRDVLALQGLLGCRIGGLTSLKQRDVELERGFVTIRNKGKVRTIPLPPDAQEILARWIRPDPTGAGRVFHAASASTIHSTLGTRHIKTACAAEGLPYFTPHALRRMVERELALAGVPIQTFAAILGHSPTVALSAYSAVRDEDMSDAFAKAKIGGAEASEEEAQ